MVERDVESGAVSLVITDDFGARRNLAHGLETGSIARERWTIRPDDPLSARGQMHWTQTLKRGDWSVRTETVTAMSCGADSFLLEGRIEAYEGERLLFQREFAEKLARDEL